VLKIVVSRYLTDPLSAKPPPCPVYRLRLSRRLPHRGSVELCKGGGPLPHDARWRAGIIQLIGEAGKGALGKMGRERGNEGGG
jgi:hypothetical protein